MLNTNTLPITDMEKKKEASTFQCPVLPLLHRGSFLNRNSAIGFYCGCVSNSTLHNSICHIRLWRIDQGTGPTFLSVKDTDSKSFKRADDLSGYDFVHRNLPGGAETKDILKVKSKDSYRKHSRQKKLHNYSPSKFWLLIKEN